VQEKNGDVVITNPHSGSTSKRACPEHLTKNDFLKQLIEAQQLAGFRPFDAFVAEASAKEDAIKLAHAIDIFVTPGVETTFSDGQLKKLVLGLGSYGLETVGLAAVFADKRFSDAEHLICIMNFRSDSLSATMRELAAQPTVTKLKTLAILESSDANTPEYNPGEISSDAAIWEQCTALETLVLDMVKMTGSNTIELPNLKRLSWVSPWPEAQAMKPLLEAPRPSLEVLALDFCTTLISDAPVYHSEQFTALMAGGYPNLKELHLTSIDFTDEFLERLLSSAMIKNLEVQNIANNNLTSRSLELLIDAQEQLSSIRMLRLNDQTDNNDNPALEAIEPVLNDSLQESYKNAEVKLELIGCWGPHQIDGLG
jgi:hypothetical protein